MTTVDVMNSITGKAVSKTDPFPVSFSTLLCSWTGYAYSTGTGNTLYTPAAGKKFALLGFLIIVPPGTTTAVGQTIYLRDNATVLFIGPTVPAAADAVGAIVSVSLSAPVISSTAANPLIATIGTAPSKSIAYTAWGYDI